MRMLLGWLLSILLLMSAYAQELGPSRRAIVFTRATVIDVKNGQPRPDMTVVVVGDRIAALGKSGTVRLPTDVQVIDATGKYLIPGLWDMHLHWAPWETPLLVANGVTGIREMGSDCHPAFSNRDCLEEVRVWQKRIEAGELGPRLLALSSWPVMARSRWPAKSPRGLAEDLPAFYAASTAEQGRQLARYFAERKVDFIKVSGHLSRDGFLGLAAEARRLGLKIAGHEQLAVNAIEASGAGMNSIEHARVFLFNCFRGATEFARLNLNEPDTTWRRRMVDEFDPGICQQVFSSFVRNDTWYVPTHLTRRMEAFADDPTFRRDSRSKYIPKARGKAWNEDADGMVKEDPSPEGRKAMKDFYTKGLEITGMARKAGVKVMLGTDSVDSYVFPGFAVHDELQELMKAGLSPAEALKAATWNGAEFLGRTSDSGSVETGKLADLILLDANPLSDIRNTEKIVAVVLNGRYIDRSALDELLKAAEEAANR
jgi:Amidohydrolase family